ncbi:MAG: hypothetical protein IPM02_04425 [Betaproteobacteria bacterium]|nr:hypothetical protein [Betaproteobacteria bacterium]
MQIIPGAMITHSPGRGRFTDGPWLRKSRYWAHMFNPHRSHLAIALIAAGILAGNSALAVRVNPDGHGQALIYPYYTARSTASGKPRSSPLSPVTNITGSPKAMRVRILEGKAGREVLDFNLFLAAYDVWTAGIIPAGAGAGLFSKDNSCTSPQVGTESERCRTSSATSRTPATSSATASTAPTKAFSRWSKWVSSIRRARSRLGDACAGFLGIRTNASKPSCAGLP